MMKKLLKTRLVFLAVVTLLVVAMPMSGAFAHSNHGVAGSTVQQPSPTQQGYYFPDYPGYDPMMSPNYQPNYDWYNSSDYRGYGWNGTNMGMGWGCW